MKGEPNRSAWSDPDNVHDTLVDYCQENGLKINFVYVKLIEKFLANPDMIKG